MDAKSFEELWAILQSDELPSVELPSVYAAMSELSTRDGGADYLIGRYAGVSGFLSLGW